MFKANINIEPTCKNGYNPDEKSGSKENVERNDQRVGQPEDRRMAKVGMLRIGEVRISSGQVSDGSQVPEDDEQEEEVHHGPSHR